MSYTIKYTSIKNVANRLRGRLTVQEDENTLVSAASGIVDHGLILQVAEQVETKLELALGQIYEVPVPQTATVALQVIGAIAEKFICAEIALTHFQVQMNPELGGDQGFGSIMRKQALEEAEVLFGGHGVYIPGIMQRPPNSQMTGEVKQPVVLPGLKLLTPEQQPDTFSRNYSCVEHRELPEEERLWT